MHKKCKSDNKIQHLGENCGIFLPPADLSEAWKCPWNKRLCRTEVCEGIQAELLHTNLSQSVGKLRKRKKKLSKVIIVSGVQCSWESLWAWHNLWWFHRLHRLHTGRRLDRFWKEKEKNTHWYVKSWVFLKCWSWAVVMVTSVDFKVTQLTAFTWTLKDVVILLSN